MNKTWQVVLITIGILLAAAFILLKIFFFHGFLPFRVWNSNYPAFQSSYGMMGGYYGTHHYTAGCPFQGANFPRLGMMGGYRPDTYTYGGPGTMGGYRSDTYTYGGPGMMGGYRSGSPVAADPLSIEQAKQAVESYLAGAGYSDLFVKEVMVFDNHAYVIAAEESTGIGALELLVDSASLQVVPEYGPNMMWNQKYGMMGGTSTADMAVSAAEAVEIAQAYLDQHFPGTTADPDPEGFYGYYTLDILRDGHPFSMLSVHGSSAEVFYHSWHGTFVEMWE